MMRQRGVLNLPKRETGAEALAMRDERRRLNGLRGGVDERVRPGQLEQQPVLRKACRELRLELRGGGGVGGGASGGD